MVTGSHALDAVSDGDDYARGFVPEHRRSSAIRGVHVVQLTVAHPGRRELHDDLVIPWIGKVYVDDVQHGAFSGKDDNARSHGRRVDQRPSTGGGRENVRPRLRHAAR